ncbi:DUF924 domain-containing protein [Halovulum dunhuangense]|uniref:DUF924 domain-containing protein n=1 Tax=Halovulum dunhuangense TaxID=1505036 RepID=A0A849L2R2_9RHOB|nr:DUF924 family protein [Halovulum dunhuangense]NNU80648.1 DUF924 domain-containing protein [Halovulum dunhuangense]
MEQHSTHEDILAFWLEETTPEQWYRQDDALDAEIRRRFAALWEKAHAAGRAPFSGGARASLANLILLDQFPRNLFRGEGRAFATDALALGVARDAIARGEDMEIDPPARQFFYLPFMHAEDLALQDAGIAHFERAMPGTDNILHARAHREIIRRFGRFPYRNGALGRKTTPEEQALLDDGGYGAVVRQMQGGSEPGA